MGDLISIVLPVYNGEKYMRESIDSVINQTYSNWELLILDDCSTDSTADIALNYTLQDSRIKYYKNEKNLKLPNNLNKGFSLSKGDYLTWTSDDNIYKSTALEEMHSALLHNENVDFVFASFDVIDASGSIVDEVILDENSISRNKGKNSVGACFLYTRKVYEAIGEYKNDYVLVEDYDYWLRIMAKFNAYVISDKLYYYRWHDGALTSTMKKTLFYSNLEKVLLENKKLYKKYTFEEYYYLYETLYEGRKNMSSPNPYKIRYYFFLFIHYVRFNLFKKKGFLK